MRKMPLRDVTGKCKGECRNRVREMEKDMQRRIDASGFKEGEHGKNSRKHSHDCSGDECRL
jgi:hypothetical protein